MHWLEVTETNASSIPARSNQSVDRPDAALLSPLIRLSRLSLLLEAFQQDILRPFDLAPSDYGVLTALCSAGPTYSMKPTQLYTQIRRSSGGMTKILRRLESAGLVDRAPDPEDGRGSRVVLTPKGRSLHERVDRALVSAATSLMSPLEPRRRRIADDALEMLLGVFEQRLELRTDTERE